MYHKFFRNTIKGTRCHPERIILSAGKNQVGGRSLTNKDTHRSWKSIIKTNQDYGYFITIFIINLKDVPNIPARFKNLVGDG